MQTRKKISAGKTALDVSSPKFCRNQRENVAGKQVTELITSSARKQKSGISFSITPSFDAWFTWFSLS